MKNNQSFSIRKACLWFVMSFSILSTVFAINPVRAEQAGHDNKISFAAGDASTLNDDVMNDKRGSGGISTTVNVTSDQNLTASSSGNSVNVKGNLTNGAINTGANFGGSGFGSYVLNTGNNATINSGVSLSVLMMPSPSPAP